MRSRIPRWSLALFLGLSQAVLAQAGAPWPAKPIRMVVGYPSGSSPDMQARLLAEPLSRALGQPVVVENRPGAGGNIGADLIAKAEDGHTIGLVGNGPLTSSKHLYPKLPYDPIKDLAPVALIGSAPLVWVVAKPTGATVTGAQYVAQARAEGDRLAYGSIGARGMRQKLFLQGWRVDEVGAQALTQRIAQDTAVYGDVIARNKIRID